MEPLIVDVSELGELTDETLFRLCAANRDIQIERTKEGELIVMSPVGGESGYRETRLIFLLELWNRQDKTGIVFSSSAGFTLKNKAMRAPDASWVRKDRWDQLSNKERKKFPPICPDFLIELMSESDRLGVVQDKMEEWMDNGCRLSWLIDPYSEKAYIYREDGSRDVISSFDKKLLGETILKGFELPLDELR